MASKLTIFLIFSLLEVSLKANGFTIDLIHRDSDQSPFHDPSSTLSDQLHASINRSISRANYVQNAITSKSSYQSNISPDTFEYLMKINLGTPYKSFLAVADTGSDLTWINCNPCKPCYKQDAPRFEPKSSSTYSDLGCDTEMCRYLPYNDCYYHIVKPLRPHVCQYEYGYGDGSLVSGSLANETFTFDTPKGSQVRVANISFGCSHQSQGTFGSKMAGLVGLGRGGLSLISQLGSSVGKKFSYCLVPRTSKSVSSKLSIGMNDVASDPDVQSTNLIHVSNNNTFYTVKLHGIKVGDKEVKVIEEPIIIDSGSTLNHLNSDIVSQVVSILEKSISLPRISDKNYALCFNASSVKTIDFPGIDFKFGVSGEVTIKMGPNTAFVWGDGGKACLAMIASDNVQIIGNVMQQNWHVGFDLDESKVYFAPADCTNL